MHALGFGAVCTVLWRQGDGGRAADIILAGGYNLARGKLCTAELLDPHAKTLPHTVGSKPPRRGGAFLRLPSLAVGRSPWSHCSEGVGGDAESLPVGGSAGTSLVSGVALAGAAGTEGDLSATPFKSPRRRGHRPAKLQ
jgi:hypothetical protein